MCPSHHCKPKQPNVNRTANRVSNGYHMKRGSTLKVGVSPFSLIRLRRSLYLGLFEYSKCLKYDCCRETTSRLDIERERGGLLLRFEIKTTMIGQTSNLLVSHFICESSTRKIPCFQESLALACLKPRSQESRSQEVGKELGGRSVPFFDTVCLSHIKT